MAFALRRTGSTMVLGPMAENGLTLFEDFPLLCQEAVLPSTPFILSSMVQAFVRYPLGIAMRRNPIVPRRQANAEIGGPLFPAQPARQRDPYRVGADVVCPFLAQSSSPLLQ